MTPEERFAERIAKRYDGALEQPASFFLRDHDGKKTLVFSDAFVSSFTPPAPDMPLEDISVGVRVHNDLTLTLYWLQPPRVVGNPPALHSYSMLNAKIAGPEFWPIFEKKVAKGAEMAFKQRYRVHHRTGILVLASEPCAHCGLACRDHVESMCLFDTCYFSPINPTATVKPDWSITA